MDSLRHVPKRDRRRKPKQSRPSKRRESRRVSTRHGADREPDLIRNVATALDDDDPATLLMLVGMMIEVTGPRQTMPFDPDPPPETPSRDELLQSFFDVEMRETSALLVALGELAGDEVLRRRTRREVISRGHALPRWLAELHRATPVPRSVEVAHVLGDGDNVLVGVRLADGHELTASVYVDHNMGSIVKDGFIVPATVDTIATHMAAVAAAPDTVVRDIDPAEARARLVAAVERGAITVPPTETDTWPQARPLVTWIAAMLPEGGRGYQRPEWTEEQRQELAERVRASPFGRELEGPDVRGLLDDLLWFGTDYGPGDPLRWSPAAVEIVLVDWIPRKIVADVAYLEKAPDVLRALIRFGHHERGIRPVLTDDTLAAVDEYEPEYQQLIRSPRPQGPAALLAAMGVPGADEGWDELPDAELADGEADGEVADEELQDEEEPARPPPSAE
jgi:hypothetical protein